jgi:hypothetical protein
MSTKARQSIYGALMDMIYTVGSQVGLVAKTIGPSITPFSLIERK